MKTHQTSLTRVSRKKEVERSFLGPRPGVKSRVEQWSIISWEDGGQRVSEEASSENQDGCLGLSAGCKNALKMLAQFCLRGLLTNFNRLLPSSRAPPCSPGRQELPLLCALCPKTKSLA